MAKTRFDTKGIKSALGKLNFNENTFHKAIAEYIWNGYDADASKVELNYEIYQDRRYAHFIKLSIKDNGKGIERHNLDKKFEPLFDSEKLIGDDYDTHQSAIHGKLGVGRLTFFTFANFAEWDTTFTKDGKRFNYKIKIEANKLDHYTSEKIEAKVVTNPTGTTVNFDGFVTFAGKDNFKQELMNYLCKEFCWLLELNKPREFQLIINGQPIDYSNYVGDKVQFEITHTKTEEKFLIRYIRWTTQLNKEYSHFYYLNQKKLEKWKETTKLNQQGDDFYHSMFITSSYFDDFDFYSSETSAQKAISGGVKSDETFKFLMDKTYSFLKSKRKPFLRIHSEKVISDLKEAGIIIVNKNDPLQVVEGKDFEEVFKELYEIQPKFFNKLSKEQKKIFIGLLRLLLKSDEREGLLERIMINFTIDFVIE